MHMRVSNVTGRAFKIPRYNVLQQCRFYTSKPSEAGEHSSVKSSTHSDNEKTERQCHSEQSESSRSSSGNTKSVAQADRELLEKLELMCGGGGDAALELENGKPVTMKRGVRNNMFRLI